MFIAIHVQEDNFHFLVIILNQINEIEARGMPVIPEWGKLEKGWL